MEKAIKKYKPTILVIDDTPGFCNSLELKAGEIFDFIPACSARNAREILSVCADKINLILLDNQMPGMDGIEFLPELRKSYKKIPVIFMTAFADPHTVKMAYWSGCAFFYIKPWDYFGILDIIKEVLEKGYVELRDKLPGQEINKGLSVIDSARDFITKKYSEYIRVEQVAQSLNITNRYLDKMFNTFLFCSTKEYLDSYRISMAKKLLKRRNINISMIHQMVGIKNRKTFTRLFYKYTHQTITEYHKNHQPLSKSN